MGPGSCALFATYATCAAAVNLFVASYSGGPWAGNVTTLSLSRRSDSTFELNQVATLNTSTNSPSWLTLDSKNNVLYMIDEATDATRGTVIAYRPSSSGILTEISRQSTLTGGVYATIYADGRGLVVPHYATGTLQTFNITVPGFMTPMQMFNFSSAGFVPGAIPGRQDTPHPHQAVLDPTENFVLIPDLGADEVHVFSIDKSTLNLTPKPSLKTKQGTGPRHSIFSSKTKKFYLVGELNDSVTAYNVTYLDNMGGLSFTEMATYDTINPSQSFPKNPDGSNKVPPAELAFSLDESILFVSNRNDTTFGASPPIDSIASFTVAEDGTLMKLPLFPAEGSFPRQFSLSPDGELMAIGLQNSGTLVVLQRVADTGLFLKQVASIKFPRGIDTPVCVVWGE